jgi:hypothetical protein
MTRHNEMLFNQFVVMDFSSCNFFSVYCYYLVVTVVWLQKFKQFVTDVT